MDGTRIDRDRDTARDEQETVTPPVWCDVSTELCALLGNRAHVDDFSLYMQFIKCDAQELSPRGLIDIPLDRPRLVRIAARAVACIEAMDALDAEGG